MKKILSIDFDYFLDTDLDTRNNKFPDGVDEKSPEELKEDWNYFYLKYPEILLIGVIKEFYQCCDALTKMRGAKVIVAQSHKDIEKVFMLEGCVKESYEVTHIDFHHDNYISGGDKLDCANWVRILMNRKPDSKIKWIKREDSEVASLSGDFPYPMTDEFSLEDSYDYIFICFSPEWTPPHLQIKYEDMLDSLSHLGLHLTY